MAAAESALYTVVERQDEFQKTSDEGRRFLGLLRATLLAGRSHLRDFKNGRDEPPNASAWGWKYRLLQSAENTYQEWQAQGQCVDWIDSDYVYLIQEVSYTVVAQLAREQMEDFTITSNS